MGRPSIAPGVYFRCFLIGYFEGIDSERGIAYRISDSLSLRGFLGLSLEEQSPDHSTLSKARRLMNLGTHQAVFRWVLKRLAAEGLLSGKKLGVDGTTLEANAALRSIVRRDNGASYEEHVRALMKAEGIEVPTPAEVARFDRKRKKSLSNREWVNPHDREARITKMKRRADAPGVQGRARGGSGDGCAGGGEGATGGPGRHGKHTGDAGGSRVHGGGRWRGRRREPRRWGRWKG